jgi:hypothetical protein
MNELQKKVGKAQFPGIEGAWILFSAKERKTEELSRLMVCSTMSFLFDAGNMAAEWEPEYGPIQIWCKCNADSADAKPHYYYDYQNSSWGNWSQTAVNEEMLPEAYLRGDYAHIFRVLARWATA